MNIGQFVTFYLFMEGLIPDSKTFFENIARLQKENTSI